jgi:hypothetical protein
VPYESLLVIFSPLYEQFHRKGKGQRPMRKKISFLLDFKVQLPTTGDANLARAERTAHVLICRELLAFRKRSFPCIGAGRLFFLNLRGGAAQATNVNLGAGFA